MIHSWLSQEWRKDNPTGGLPHENCGNNTALRRLKHGAVLGRTLASALRAAASC